MGVTPTELEILRDIQIHGDNVPTNIAENIDAASKYVNRKLADLEDRGLVRNKGRGVWTLSPDGRKLVRSEFSEESE